MSGQWNVSFVQLELKVEMVLHLTFTDTYGYAMHYNSIAILSILFQFVNFIPQ